MSLNDGQMTLVHAPLLPRWMLLLALGGCGARSQSGEADASSNDTAASTVSTMSTGALAPPDSASSDTPGPPDTAGSGAPTTEILANEGSTSAPPDLPPEPPISCDPHAETPCPEGQKCSAAASEWSPWLLYTGTPACYPILGDKEKGEPCELGRGLFDGLDECAPGLVCADIYLAWGTAGVCVEFCDPAIKDGFTNQACDDPKEFCSAPACQECLLSLCVPACDPLAPDCPDGTGCVLAYVNSDYAFECEAIQPDMPEAGEDCPNYECAPGASCVLAETVANPTCAGNDACCTPLCDLDAPNTCPGAAMGEVCQPFFPEPFDPILDPWSVQYDDLGICLLP